MLYMGLEGPLYVDSGGHFARPYPRNLNIKAQRLHNRLTSAHTISAVIVVPIIICGGACNIIPRVQMSARVE